MIVAKGVSEWRKQLCIEFATDELRNILWHAISVFAFNKAPEPAPDAGCRALPE